MASQPNNQVRDDLYAYMFRSGERRFLFICNFGAGVESVAQLVEDVDSGVNLIRKVTAKRLLKDPSTGEDWQLQKPREIKILDTIKNTFKAPEPGLSFNVVECYGHEYIKSKDQDNTGLAKYHSVSYWKLCNGRSLYKRWLTGDILPPAVAVARMVRQVLSTLHHLYTAGEKPIYHGDLHFGNIWMHWSEGTLLPDFYVGDFADAGFFDSDYHAGEGGRAGTLSLKDLHNFWYGLNSVCEMIGSRRGYGNRGAKALRRLSSDISDVLVSNRNIGSLDPPPNLKPLIRLAQDVEDMFGEGGEAAETDSAPYTEFVTGERIGALMAERQQGLVVFASKKDALRPGYTRSLAHVPRAIHGPWQLVRAPDWAPVEGDVTHHRPNRNRAGPGEDLSNSKRLTGDIFMGAVLIEPDIGNFSSDGSYTTNYHSGGQSSVAERTSPANSWKAGDDAHLQHAHLDKPQGPQNVEEPSPAFSWTKGDEDNFQAQDLQNPEESDVSDDWDLLVLHDECEARIASHRRRLVARAKPSSQQTQIPTISVMEPAEDRIQHWHTMLHGVNCKCADHAWQADVEAMFMHERVRRVRGGLPTEADWSFRDPDGLAG